MIGGCLRTLELLEGIIKPLWDLWDLDFRVNEAFSDLNSMKRNLEILSCHVFKTLDLKVKH